MRMRASQLPDVDHVNVDSFITEASSLATPELPLSLLIALAWSESRFDPMAKPMCGVLQVSIADLGDTPDTCEAMRSRMYVGVFNGIVELNLQLSDRRVRGDIRRALEYRACGNSAFVAGCPDDQERWIDFVFTLERALRTRVDVGACFDVSKKSGRWSWTCGR